MADTHLTEDDMTEFPVARRHLWKPRQRQFRSRNLELSVHMSWWGWGPPSGFQLVYDKAARESALTWTSERGFVHRREDQSKDDETRGLLRYYDKKPRHGKVLDDRIDVDRLIMQFERAAESLPPQIAELVIGKLSQLR